MRRSFGLHGFGCNRRHSCSREADAVDGLPSLWNDARGHEMGDPLCEMDEALFNNEALQGDVMDAILSPCTGSDDGQND